MQELIDIGIRQGTVIRFPEATTDKSVSYRAIVSLIQNGRFGESQRKGVSTESLFVTLTQDCSIANSSKYIELAQLKKCKVKNESKIENLLLGRDYSKLILKIEDDYFELEEILITKIKKQDLLDNTRVGYIEAQRTLPIRSIKILLDWRLLAYFREPFPDKFNQTLFTYLRESECWFTDFLIEYQQHIHSIRLYVTPDDENAEQYQFSMCALLTESGEEKQEHIEGQIDRMLLEFGQCQGVDCLQVIDSDSDTMILPEHLVLSLTSSLDEFTFATAYVMREFNFQYLCY